ncbi:hypothetical protein BGZ50_006752, partial [Haplosporangium sp. Z 11]
MNTLARLASEVTTITSVTSKPSKALLHRGAGCSRVVGPRIQRRKQGTRAMRETRARLGRGFKKERGGKNQDS